MPSERGGTLGFRDSGAVAVETSIVSMLLVLILFGIIDTSFLFKDWLTVSAAARAGARMGASEPRTTNFAQDSADQVTNAMSDLDKTSTNLAVWVYKTSAAAPSPPANCNGSSNCIPFTWDGAKLTTTTTALGNWTASSQNACPGDVTAPNLRDSLGVYVNYKHSSPLGNFFPNINNATVSESTVMWLEPSFAIACK